jgi:hypothetical protein
MKQFIQLFESFSPPVDEFMYKGYECRIPFVPNRNAWGAAVWENGEYRYGLRGWTTKEKAIEWAKNVVDSHILRAGKNKFV